MGFPFNLNLTGAKDKSISKLLLASVRQYLKDFGEVRDLVLDTAARTITFEVLPTGEAEPITLVLSGYGLTTDEQGRGWFTFETCSFSREWLTQLVGWALPKKKVRLPAGTPIGLLQGLL